MKALKKINIIFCIVFCVYNLNAQPIKLMYSFKKIEPFCFKVNAKHEYLIGDGNYIYVFNMAGKLEKQINISLLIHKRDYQEFEITTDKTTLYIKSYNVLYKLSLENNSILDSLVSNVSILKIANNDSLFCIKENVSSIYGKELEDKLMIFNNKRTIFFPTLTDFKTLNFEIIDDKIFMHTGDNIFYSLSLGGVDFSRQNLVVKDGENIWFLGDINNNHVFKFFNASNHKDILYFYNSDLKFLDSTVINENYKDISKDFRDKYYLDYPSGNIYTYINNKIYYMRTVKGTTYINVLGNNVSEK